MSEAAGCFVHWSFGLELQQKLRIKVGIFFLGVRNAVLLGLFTGSNSSEGELANSVERSVLKSDSTRSPLDDRRVESQSI